MSSILAKPESFTVDDFLSRKNLDRLDETLHEICAIMLGLEVHADDGAGDSNAGGERAGSQTKAVVSFTGVMCGTCEICLDGLAVLAVANAMLGGDPAEEFDASMCDAVGELCNMVAGGWKNRVAALESCSLAPPTVSSGRQEPTGETVAGAAIYRNYVFRDHRISLTLLLETLSPSAAESVSLLQ